MDICSILQSAKELQASAGQPRQPEPQTPETPNPGPEIPPPTLPTPELPGNGQPGPEIPGRGDPRNPPQSYQYCDSTSEPNI